MKKRQNNVDVLLSHGPATILINILIGRERFTSMANAFRR